MIAIRDLSKRFGATTVLDGITASIGEGEFAVLLGSNGAGKTTLLRCLLGLLGFEGTITIGGRDVTRDGRAARRLMGYVPQRPSFPPDLTCGEVLDLFARLRGLRRGDADWLARVGLGPHVDAAVHVLSGGMRQRLALAVALQTDPAVILFDEPAAYLDVPARSALHRDLEVMTGGGRTVLLATHFAADPLRVASCVLVLDRGRLVYKGPPDGIRLAVQQRVIFTLNGTGREQLLSLLDAMPGIQLTQTPGAVIAATRAGGAFELLAAVAAAGVRPLEVHLEEPSIDSRRLVPDTEERSS